MANKIRAAKQIQTVNVIEMKGGSVSSMDSWKDTPAGNKAAEALFRSKSSSAGCPDLHLDSAVEDGFFEAPEAGHDILLVHSC